MILQEGEIINGTYEVERFLGEGAFAEVYRVRHKFLGRQALKLLKRLDMTQSELERELGEVLILSRIGHPNIVRVFDANTVKTAQGSCGYFTMEYVAGGTLDRFWHSYGVRFVPVETVVDIAKQICRGLAVAHRSQPPIIHRDIKPQNILIGYEAEGLRVRVSDFGLAREVNPLTLLATAAGTLAFKPPEVFNKKHSDSTASDIFAVGVVMYLLLTDRYPYEIDADLGWNQKEAFAKSAEVPGSVNFDVDPLLDGIVMKCLSLRAEDRYKDASELLSALDKWHYAPQTLDDAKSSKSEVQVSRKDIMGSLTLCDEETARALVQAARRLAREGMLNDAADKMEEAFNQDPNLRGQYANTVRLWRAGVSM